MGLSEDQEKQKAETDLLKQFLKSDDPHYQKFADAWISSMEKVKQPKEANSDWISSLLPKESKLKKNMKFLLIMFVVTILLLLFMYLMGSLFPG